MFGHIHAARGLEHVEDDGILRVYDGVMAGDKGLLAFFFMACRWVGERLWSAVSRRKERRGTEGGTTLVNALLLQVGETRRGCRPRSSRYDAGSGLS